MACQMCRPSESWTLTGVGASAQSSATSNSRWQAAPRDVCSQLRTCERHVVAGSPLQGQVRGDKCIRVRQVQRIDDRGVAPSLHQPPWKLLSPIFGLEMRLLVRNVALIHGLQQGSVRRIGVHTREVSFQNLLILVAFFGPFRPSRVEGFPALRVTIASSACVTVIVMLASFLTSNVASFLTPRFVFRLVVIFASRFVCRLLIILLRQSLRSAVVATEAVVWAALTCTVRSSLCAHAPVNARQQVDAGVVWREVLEQLRHLMRSPLEVQRLSSQEVFLQSTVHEPTASPVRKTTWIVPLRARESAA